MAVRKISRSIMAMMFLVTTAGCSSITIENGEVPSAYIGSIEPFLGQYKGQFAGVDGAIRFWLDQQVLRVTYSSEGSDDILGVECDSKIGLLKEIGEKRLPAVGEVVYTSFRFSAGKCKDVVWGRELVMFFIDPGSEMVVRILQNDTWVSDSAWCLNESYPGPEWCNLRPVGNYLVGVFNLLTNSHSLWRPTLGRTQKYLVDS